MPWNFKNPGGTLDNLIDLICFMASGLSVEGVGPLLCDWLRVFRALSLNFGVWKKLNFLLSYSCWACLASWEAL